MCPVPADLSASFLVNTQALSQVLSQALSQAIRRHWALVCGAFCCCWWAQSPSQQDPAQDPAQGPADGTAARALPLPPEAGAGENGAPGTTGDLLARAQWLRATAIHSAVLATGAASSPELA